MATSDRREKSEGTVKWFSFGRGYGFIMNATGDYFVHHRDIIGQSKPRGLEKGQIVTFRPVSTRKGPEAKEVEVMK